MARNQPNSPYTWAILGGVGGFAGIGRRDVVIRCKETTQKFLGLRRADNRFIGKRVQGTRYRAMMGGGHGESYTLKLDKQRSIGGVRVRTLGLTVPQAVTVNELVFWMNRNAPKVDYLITPKGVSHVTKTGAGDAVADFAEDALDLVGDAIPDFGDAITDGLQGLGNVADRLLPDNPGQLIGDVAGLINAGRALLPNVP